MAHGGARPRAGRKKGAATRMNEQARLEAAQSGETPLEYMLRVMRDVDAEKSRRDDMAKSAAPYLHAKLSSVELAGSKENPLQINVVNYASK